MKLRYFLLIFISSSLFSITGPFKKIPVVGGPGPLFAFGQNVIPKNLLIQSTTVDHLDLKNESATGVSISLLYGITDSLAVQLEIPYVRRRKDIFGKAFHSGVGDISLYTEYALINKQTEQLVRQWTIAAELFFPSSHFENGLLSNLLLDRGTYSGFIGTTLSNITPEWYIFGSMGSILPSKNKKVKYGAVILYECGFGKSLLSTEHSYVAGILELSGIKRFPDPLEGSSIKPTESNIIYLGPVLRWAYDKIVLQGGFQKPIFQNIKGNENKRHIRISTSFAIEFEF